MSKNTRWALAIVGVVIIAVAAFAIGTGKDDTQATKPVDQPTAATPATTGSTGASPATGATGGQGTGQGGSGTDNGSGTGGASPKDSGSGTGGASPQEDTGGAQAQTGSISPVLGVNNVRTIVVNKGETVVIRGRSSQAAEMHLHGYDKEIELTPGEIGRIKVKATIDGEFAIEFHLGGSETQVGTLRVNP